MNICVLCTITQWMNGKLYKLQSRSSVYQQVLNIKLGAYECSYDQPEGKLYGRLITIRFYTHADNVQRLLQL